MATLIPQHSVHPNPPDNNNNSYTPDNQILTRLDAYLPALNTGLMDGKIQDVIIKHPLVRTLVVPECDLEARRRCIALISKALGAATPVLPLILQDHQSNHKKRKVNASGTFDSHRIPKLSLEAQSRLITIVASMAERDALIRFWMNHHVMSQQHQKEENNNKKRKYSTSSASSTTSSSSNQSKYLEMSTFDLYLKVKTSKELLADLADRIQGAVCKAFWECWDEIFITLAEIVGADLLQKADQGRIFRPCGDAAIYLNNLKVTRKRQVEQKRRLSMLEGEVGGNRPINHTISPNTIHMNNLMGSPFSPDQFLNELGVGGHSSVGSTSIPTSLGGTTTTTPFALPLSPDKSSGSPDSDTSLLFGLTNNHNGLNNQPTMHTSSSSSSTHMNVPTPPSSTSGSSISSNSNVSKLPLIDSNDLGFIMQDVYQENKNFDQYLGAFTTLDDDFNTPATNNHPANSTTSSTPQTFATPQTAGSPQTPSMTTNMPSSSNTTTTTSSSSSNSHLNLRQRIKLMEEGRMPEEKPSSSHIVW